MCGYTTVYFYLLVHHLMLYNVDDKSTALCFTLVFNSDINKFQLLMSVSVTIKRVTISVENYQLLDKLE